MLKTRITDDERNSPEFNQNKSAWVERITAFRQVLAEVRKGGGDRAIERQHQKGRLTARERIERLLDPGSRFYELLTLAGYGMYEEWGGAPSGGVVAGVGRVAGRDWMIIANDATVKAGAFFPITAKKVIRAQTIALENRIPTIYLVDSSGVFLPLQDEVFPDQDDFGRIFYLNARMSALGIPQISAIMGNCVAGGAYLPVMTDVLVMTEGSGLYLAGPALVKAAIGQEVSSDELGGARMHAEVSGTVDFYEPDDESALRRVREVAALYAERGLAPWAKNRTLPEPPAHDPEDLYGLVSPTGERPYDVREVIARIVDGSRFLEYRPGWGETIVTGYARIGGYPVAIVANQRLIIRKREKIEVGGVIYPEAADKAARFILEANQMFIPLVFLQDVTGFMVGRDAEHAGIIRRGAKMVNAVSNSVVPKLTVILGGSFGAGNYAMAGKAYAPRFIYAWPSAKYAVMGGAQAAKTLLDLQLRALKARGQEPTDEELSELYEEIKRRYDEQLDVRYAAARLWVDEVIFPHETREWLIQSLSLAALNPERPEFKTGVFQV